MKTQHVVADDNVQHPTQASEEAYILDKDKTHTSSPLMPDLVQTWHLFLHLQVPRQKILLTITTANLQLWYAFRIYNV
jgi:hypothetical protein